MAYHADVRFLDNCNPELIERNAAEFARVRNLLASVEPSVHQAKDGTSWVSEHRQHYDARLGDVSSLVTALSGGFDRAGGALLRYADEVGRAKQQLEAGIEAEDRLDRLISSVAVAVTRTAQRAEPMRRWEDIRETTGFLDWVAELGMDVDRIRDEATRAYNDAGRAFGQAQSIERAARDDCLSQLNRAHDELPDFRGDFRAAAALIADLAPLRDEVTQAQADPNVRLSGGGALDSNFPAGKDDVSPALQRIRDLAATLPAGQSPWHHDVVGGWRDADRHEFIAANRDLINAAARESGLPADLLAGIAWKEAGGKPYLLDDVTDTLRRAAESDWSPVTPENLPGRLGAPADSTSFGPMAVQVRRAAEVLGYDPANLTDGQRDQITSALKDPAQNIFIAARYLENLKAESGFADVPAGQLTPAQYQELAARYNGGPYWRAGSAQDYGQDMISHLPDARSALR